MMMRAQCPEKKYKYLPENVCQVQHICVFVSRLLESYFDKWDSFDRGVKCRAEHV